ncbi:TPA: hypothetical protein SAN82_004176 [Pseudomonas putida]|nr:hypothetical protein [Pseudomonas putida]
MKPPKKVPKNNTQDTDLPTRNTSADEAPAPRHPLPDINIPDPSLSPSRGRRPENESDNIPQEPLATVSDVSMPAHAATHTAGDVSDINFLPTVLIANLSAPLANGLRYGKRNSMYAEIENEGITLVRHRDDGEYQASSANELNASGPLLERIAGTVYWRRKNTAEIPHAVDPQPARSTDEQPGPSTRERSHPDSRPLNLIETNPILAEMLARPIPHPATSSDTPLDLSVGLWKNWGRSTRPESGESVEINGLHYRIVPHGSPERTGVVFLEHPRYSPSRYEAFEQVLHDDPSLQPRWGVRKDGQWTVLENPLPFDRSLTAYVARTFKDFSDESLNTTARTLFNRANDSEVINAYGLLVLRQTFYNWAGVRNATIPRPEFADPLLMLPVINRTIRNASRLLILPDSAGTLRRLDFTPDRFPTEWNDFVVDPSGYNFKQLMRNVLERNGYDVFPLTNGHLGPTLVFTRPNHDSLFFLKLGHANGDAISDITPPGNELSDPHLAARIGEPAHTALRTAYDQNKVVWLVGGIQTTASGGQKVFIIREG